MASFYLGAAGNASSITATCMPNTLASTPMRCSRRRWRLTPKLTLNYSLRWDYISPFKEKYNNLSFIDPLGANPGAGQAGTVPEGLLCGKQVGSGKLRQGLSRKSR